MIFRRTVLTVMFCLVCHSAYSSTPWILSLTSGLSGSRGIFFADLTGDGAADAIMVNDDRVTVHLSTGTEITGFMGEEWWISGPYGSRGTFFADVTGDGKADAIAVNDDAVTVRPSNGWKFLPSEDWGVGPYYGSRGTFFADVTGDGKADAIVINDDRVTVRRSSGSQFQSNEAWTSESYYGNRGTFFADVTGDGKADMIAVNDYMVTVRVSDGSQFLSPKDWASGLYYGNRGTFFADVTGDGKADAVVVNDLTVTVRASNGTQFLSPEDWAPAGELSGNARIFFADVTKDRRADAIVARDHGVYVRQPPPSPGVQQASVVAGDWVFNQNGYWSTLQIVPDPNDPVKFTGSLEFSLGGTNSDPNPGSPIRGRVFPGGTQVEFWRTLPANTEQHFQGFVTGGADPYKQEMAGTVDGIGGWFACKGRTNGCDVPPPGAVGGEISPTPLDPTVITPLADATSFLYTGSNAVQTGVALGTIHPEHVAVIRGRVLDAANHPLPGVAITILNQPELGQTLSRADGRFDLAVNGGGQLTVSYVKDGYLLGQRQVNAPWQGYVMVDDTILIQQDTKSTVINLEDTTQAFHVAQGSPVTDQDGTRQATLLIPQGTQAKVYNPDDTNPDSPTSTVTSLNLRLTEYTAGANGQSSMPAPLPPSSAFTYAFEMRADEAAIKKNGKDVVFDRPVPFYIDNFLNFPVGTAVPVGYYDQDKGVWVPSDNGKVIKILTVTNGTVDLDTDGDGVADDEAKLTLLGISADEKARLAGLYPAGKSLWRVQVKHLSTWDCNWPYKMPDDAEAPKNPEPTVDDTEDDPSCKSGSIIECQNQILSESLPITGTGMTLNYASNRVEGGKARKTAAMIQLTGANIPASLIRIDLEVDIAGRHFEQSFSRERNEIHTSQRHPFVWDGLDAFGRKVNGGTSAKIRIGYVYSPVYATPAQQQAAFALFSGIPLEGSRARNEIRIWQEFTTQLGMLTVQAQSMGGWTLSHHHSYDPTNQTLYLGTGEHRSAKAAGISIITTVAGKTHNGVGGNDDGGLATDAKLHITQGVAVGSDGSFYFADYGNQRIRRVARNGIISTAAGRWDRDGGFSGDGGPATAAQLNFPTGVAVGQDGSLYIADRDNHRIRQVDPKGTITTVAGNGRNEFGGDGGLATQASLSVPEKVAVGPDGSLYIADRGNNLIRRVGLDGIISTVVGKTRTGGFSGDGGPAKEAQLNSPTDVAVGLDGSLYIADQGNGRIRRVRPDGIISTVAGTTHIGGFGGDGGLAVEAQFASPTSVAISPNRSLYIADRLNSRIRRVGPDGIIRTVVGNRLHGFGGDDGPATDAKLDQPTSVAVDPVGNLYIADSSNLRIRRVTSTLPGFSADDLSIASADGTQLYRFDARGRHLQTLNAVTGSILYQFNYDTAGRLISIRDADGNTTTIERDTTGNPIAVVAPFGQRTTLKTDANGYLASVDNPAGEAYQMTYTKDGLLTEFKDPKGNVSQMSYDELGQLKSDTDAAGGSQKLVRTETDRSYTVSLRTSLGRTTSYLVEHQPIGDTRRLTTAPDGTKTETIIGTDGGRKTTLADRTVINLLEGPDPRFSMQAPIPKSLTMTTGDLTSTLSADRTVKLADSNKPLSLVSQTDTITLNGRTSNTVYDAVSKTTTITSAVGRINKVTADDLGRIVQSQVAGLSGTRISYDTHGRLDSIAQGSAPDARTVRYAYNPQGYLESLTDPLNRNVNFSYDQVGRVTRKTLPDGRVVTYGYDANGNLASLTPPGRPAHVFKYNKVGQTSAYEPPPVAGTGNTVYEYNPDKDLTKITRPDGQSLTFDYDTAGRLQTLTLPSSKLSYGYDTTTGKLAEIAAQDAKLAYTHNGALLVKTIWTGSVTGQVERAYDNDFRVKSLTVNGANPITFQYDSDSLLERVGDLTLTRSAQNGLLETTGLVGVTDSYAYNGFGEVIAYEAKANAASLLRLEYTYDKLGRITQKKEIRNGTQIFEYGYDTAGHLAEVKRDGAVTASYIYDANGNRTHLNGSQIAHYDDQDRLIDYQDATYQYSANGELLQKLAGGQVTKYSYDVIGNLKKVTLSNGVVIDYLIDGQSRRIGKKLNGSFQQGFLYQGQLQPIAELNSNGEVVSRFVYGTRVNVPDYMIKNGATYRIIKDHLGSPRLVINVASNTVAQEMGYDAFGNVTQDTNPGFQPFGFAGGIYDKDTKLVRFGARDYDSQIGRWLARDPILFRGGDANTYNYITGNPVSYTDPSGFSVELCQRMFNPTPVPYARHCYLRFNGKGQDTVGFSNEGSKPDGAPPWWPGMSCKPTKGNQNNDACVREKMNECKGDQYNFTEFNCCHCAERALTSCGISPPVLPNYPVNSPLPPESSPFLQVFHEIFSGIIKMYSGLIPQL